MLVTGCIAPLSRTAARSRDASTPRPDGTCHLSRSRGGFLGGYAKALHAEGRRVASFEPVAPARAVVCRLSTLIDTTLPGG